MSPPPHDPPPDPAPSVAGGAAARGADRWTRHIIEVATDHAKSVVAARLLFGLTAALGLAAALCWAAGSPFVAGALAFAAAAPAVFAVEFGLLAVSNRRAHRGEIAAVRCSACDYAIAAWRHRAGVKLNALFGLPEASDVWEFQIWPATAFVARWTGVLAVASAACSAACFGVLAALREPPGAEFRLIAVPAVLLTVLLAVLGALLVVMSRWRPAWPPREVYAGRACPLCWEPLRRCEPGAPGDA